MANTKISALTSASTPLAGTEVLPIVQSSATVKVATNDLTVRNVRANATTGILQVTGPTAGTTRVATVPDANWTAARTDSAQSFTGDQTLSTGNVIQGTTAKGYNFTANTPQAGMTSQLLNWYEEGTFTPVTSTITTVSGTPVYTGQYTRIGRQVFLSIDMTGGNISITAGNTFTNLPFTAGRTCWGTTGNSGFASTGGFCLTSLATKTLYLATTATYTGYFGASVTYTI